MARKNRKKLHHELRLRAETRKQALVLARKTRAAQAQASLRVVAEVFRRPVHVAAATGDAAFELFLSNCNVSAAVRGRARAILEVARRAGVEQLAARYGVITLLAHQPSTGALRVEGGGWAALVQRALGPWPVPAFLIDALRTPQSEVHRVPWELSWLVHLARTVARGGSVGGLVGTRHLPAPLTRRMVSLFLGSDAAPMVALRCAQVEGCSGPAWLGPRLVKTRLGQLQGPDAHAGEPWWAQVITWLSAHPDAAEGDLWGTIEALASLRARSSREAPFSLKGRTPASLFGVVTAELERLGALSGETFPLSGLRPLRGRGWEGWTFRELRSKLDLVEEAGRMRHCAVHYAPMCAQGVTSVWSARASTSQLTIEIVRPAGCVAQVRGFANRLPTADETRVVQAWARQNHLAWSA